MGRRVIAGLVGALFALVPVSGAGARTTSVRSFGGTSIHVNFFTAAGLAPGKPVPTVLPGPGWGSPGDTNPNDTTSVSGGSPGVGTLRHAGFNVITWDPRGFGVSGGKAEVDKPGYEGRDVSALISWLARQPEAQLDRPGDPRVGMAGGSYGGGIQLVAAAADHRIDAIVPDIAWHSLLTSLDKYNTPKLGWGTLLYDVASLGSARLDPLIGDSYQTEVAGNPLTSAERNFYAASGPGALVGKIRAPTLLVQGTVDDLFTLQEAVDNYTILHRDHVPLKMLWFCGGHGICLTDPGNTALIQRDTLAWLDRYLKREANVNTGPAMQWVDQKGGEHTGTGYPLPGAGTLSAHGAGVLPINASGGSGPAVPGPGAGTLGTFAAKVTPARASNAINVRLRSPRRTALVVGAPQLTITYRGRSTNHHAATSLYAQLVDDATGKVLGNQVTPVPITLDGATHTLSVRLEILAAADRPGEQFTLQLTPSTVAYVTQSAIGSATFSAIRVVLPLVR